MKTCALHAERVTRGDGTHACARRGDGTHACARTSTSEGKLK